MGWSLLGLKCGACGGRTRDAVPAPKDACGREPLVCKACSTRLEAEREAELEARHQALVLGAALVKAARRGDAASVLALLDKGTGVNTRGYGRVTALIAAAGRDECGSSFNVVRALLDNGAEVNARMNDGKTALTLASQKGHSEVRACLLQAGAVE